MEIKTIQSSFLNNELQQNTYIITIDNKCFIIDAGAPIQDILKITNNRKIEAVLITHCHYDHICHIEEYDKNFSCPIYINENGKLFLENPDLNLSGLFASPIKYKLKNIKIIKNDKILNINNINIIAYYTPGHTNDSMCYLFPNKILFTGDTLFKNSVGATHLPTGNYRQLQNSLKKLLKIDFENIYAGHMETTTKNEQIKNINYFIENFNY